jgi:hypothetical protein
MTDVIANVTLNQWGEFVNLARRVYELSPESSRDGEFISI